MTKIWLAKYTKQYVFTRLKSKLKQNRPASKLPYSLTFLKTMVKEKYDFQKHIMVPLKLDFSFR